MKSRCTMIVGFLFCFLLLSSCASAGIGLGQAKRPPESTTVIHDGGVPLAELPESLKEEPDSPVSSDKLADQAEVYGTGDFTQAEASEEEIWSAVQQVADYYQSGVFPVSTGESADRYPTLPEGTQMPADLQWEDVTLMENYFFYAYAATVSIGNGKEMLMGFEYDQEQDVWTVAAIMYRDV